MTVNSRLLPATRETYYDPVAIESDDKSKFLDYMRRLTNDISEMYKQIVTKYNLGPEFVPQASQPTPAEGQFLVWNKTSDSTYWLLYNDGGTVKKVQMT
jgi:hypothetical protein